MKISLKRLIIILSITLGLGVRYVINDYKTYKYIKNIYIEINSEKSKPTEEQSKKIKVAVDEIVSEIGKSDKWNKFNKQAIIDSLNNIEYRVVDSLNSKLYSKNYMNACFLNVSGIKEHFLSNFLKEPGQSSIIFINSEILNENDEYVKDILIHELYHYIDKLYNEVSDRLELNQFCDTSITNTTYAVNKMLIIYYLKSSNSNVNDYYLFNRISDKEIYKMPNDFINIISEQVIHIIKMRNYYRSNHEIFARWMTLKQEMVKLRIINSITDTVNKELITEYLVTKNFKSMEDLEIEILFVLDINRIDKFDEKVTKVLVK